MKAIVQFFHDLREISRYFLTTPIKTLRWYWSTRREPNNRAKFRRFLRAAKKGLV